MDGKYVCLQVVQLFEVFRQVFPPQDEAKTLLSVKVDFLTAFVLDCIFWNCGRLSFYSPLMPWTSQWIQLVVL